jgi:Esterase-like activity of phytase
MSTRRITPLKTRSTVVTASLAVMIVSGIFLFVPKSSESHGSRGRGSFQRTATFDVSGEIAEIVASTVDGRTLIYTNSGDEVIGFVDITDPKRPAESGTLAMGGEPTSVATTPNGRWALVTVNASPDQLLVVDLNDRAIETMITLGGQPDSIAISPDGEYAAIVIENERDEDVNDGAMPQSPAGFLTIVDLDGPPSRWKTRDVSLTGLATRFPDDPEPEFVKINSSNQAAVTLQENNHVVIVNLKNGSIITHWPAGTTSHAADITSDNDISLTGQIDQARREPDAIVWTPDGRLITANEGDYTVDLGPGGFAGGRDFTVFSVSGEVVYEPGARLELEAVKAGHYPDSRSDSKGIEPEGAEIGIYDRNPFLFIGSERGNFVAVYDISNENRPKFRQILPTGSEPEGLLAITHRNLFVTANEGDGTISIFTYRAGEEQPDYPDVISDGLAWSAFSGFALGPDRKLYAVPDTAFAPSRIFTLSNTDPIKVKESRSLGRNFDLEGIAIRPQGGFWSVSEGAGNTGESGATKNLLIDVDTDGSIRQEIQLPASVNVHQRQYGFEGVATNHNGSKVYVAFQREWADDPMGLVKIGEYTPGTGDWKFFHYPLDSTPVAGAWVGLSEIARVDDDTFAVLERDNQLRQNARIKRVYTFSLAGIVPVPAGNALPVVTKTLVRDLLVQDGFLLEKAEAMAITPIGDYLIANDNDGGGETRIFRFPNPRYDICLEDDDSGDLLRFNSGTGEYIFAHYGSGEFTLTGRGSITRHRCSLKLSDSRVFALIDSCGFEKSGVALIRPSRFGWPFKISDRNMQ